MEHYISFLNANRKSLEKIEYSDIYKSICGLETIFLTKATLLKGEFIDRIRTNSKTHPCFTTKEEISYNKNNENIKKIGFERANMPGQVMFYGSIKTKEIQNPYVTAYFETSRIINNANNRCCISETFTVGRWLILDDIPIVEMIFCDEALKVNSNLRLSFDQQIKEKEYSQHKEKLEEQCRFFSNEFARNDIKSPDDYKISAAFSNFIWNNTKFKGITYPSVKTNYNGQNIVLKPEVVDSSLRLTDVYMCKFRRFLYKNKPITPLRHIELKEHENIFHWNLM